MGLTVVEQATLLLQAAIEADGHVPMDIDFDPELRQRLEDAFRALPDKVTQHVKKIAAAPELGARHGQCAVKGGTIKINPSVKDNKTYTPEHVVAHESGHSMYDNLMVDQKNAWRKISRWQKGQPDGNAAPYVEKRKGWPAYTATETHAKDAKFVSDYAGKNASEDFADSVAVLLTGDKSQVPQEKADFINGLLGKKVECASCECGDCTLHAKSDKPKCPHCGSHEYSLMPTDFETAKCAKCGKTWDHGIVKGINDPGTVTANYKLSRRTEFAGMKISIETDQGETREGIGHDGKPWKVTMPWPYGYIRGTMGPDGDHVDCFIGPDADAKEVYVIHQHIDDQWDEDKCMLGFESADIAKQAYCDAYSNGGAFYKSMTAMPIEDFKTKVMATKDKKRHDKIHADNDELKNKEHYDRHHQNVDTKPSGMTSGGPGSGPKKNGLSIPDLKHGERGVGHYGKAVFPVHGPGSQMPGRHPSHGTYEQTKTNEWAAPNTKTKGTFTVQRKVHDDGSATVTRWTKYQVGDHLITQPSEMMKFDNKSAADAHMKKRFGIQAYSEDQPRDADGKFTTDDGDDPQEAAVSKMYDLMDADGVLRTNKVFAGYENQNKLGIPGDAYVAATLSNEHKDVDPSKLIATQGRLDSDHMEQLLMGGTKGADSIVIHFKGKDYLLDGHHRAAASVIQGNKSMSVCYHDADTARGLTAREERIRVIAQDALESAMVEILYSKPINADFDESQHPRGPDGKFVGGGGEKITPSDKAQKLKQMGFQHEGTYMKKGVATKDVWSKPGSDHEVHVSKYNTTHPGNENLRKYAVVNNHGLIVQQGHQISKVKEFVDKQTQTTAPAAPPKPETVQPKVVDNESVIKPVTPGAKPEGSLCSTVTEQAALSKAGFGYSMTIKNDPTNDGKETEIWNHPSGAQVQITPSGYTAYGPEGKVESGNVVYDYNSGSPKINDDLQKAIDDSNKAKSAPAANPVVPMKMGPSVAAPASKSPALFPADPSLMNKTNSYVQNMMKGAGFVFTGKGKYDTDVWKHPDGTQILKAKSGGYIQNPGEKTGSKATWGEVSDVIQTHLKEASTPPPPVDHPSKAAGPQVPAAGKNNQLANSGYEFQKNEGGSDFWFKPGSDYGAKITPTDATHSNYSIVNKAGKEPVAASGTSATAMMSDLEKMNGPKPTSTSPQASAYVAPAPGPKKDWTENTDKVWQAKAQGVVADAWKNASTSERKYDNSGGGMYGKIASALGVPFSRLQETKEKIGNWQGGTTAASGSNPLGKWAQDIVNNRDQVHPGLYIEHLVTQEHIKDKYDGTVPTLYRGLHSPGDPEKAGSGPAKGNIGVLKGLAQMSGENVHVNFPVFGAEGFSSAESVSKSFGGSGVVITKAEGSLPSKWVMSSRDLNPGMWTGYAGEHEWMVACPEAKDHKTGEMIPKLPIESSKGDKLQGAGNQTEDQENYMFELLTKLKKTGWDYDVTGNEVTLFPPVGWTNAAWFKLARKPHPMTASEAKPTRRLIIAGLPPIQVEWEVGQKRTGTDKNGRQWSQIMPFAYGRFEGTKGLDGEPVDCILGRDSNSPKIFIACIPQNLGNEEKVMVGFKTAQQAKIAFLACYGYQQKFLQTMGEITKPMLVTLMKVRQGKSALLQQPRSTSVIAMDYFESTPGLNVLPTSYPPSLKNPKLIEEPLASDGWHQGDSKKKRRQAKKDMVTIMKYTRRQIGKPELAQTSSLSYLSPYPDAIL